MKKPRIISLSRYFLTAFVTSAVFGIFSPVSIEASGSDNPNNPDKVCKYEKDDCNSCESGTCDDSSDNSENTYTHTVKKDEACPEPVELGLGDGWELVDDGGASLPGNYGRRGAYHLVSTTGDDTSSVSPSSITLPVTIPGAFSPNYVALNNLKLYGQGVEVVRDADTNIRQVKGLNALLDVVSLGERSLEIRFYLIENIKPSKQNGIYVPKDGMLPLRVTRYIQDSSNLVRTEIINNSSNYPGIKSETLEQHATSEPNTVLQTKTYYNGQGDNAAPVKKVTKKLTAVTDGQPSEEKYLITTREIGTDGQWHLTSRIAGRRAIYKEEDGFVTLYKCDAVDEDGNTLAPISTQETCTYYTNNLNPSSFGKIRTLRRSNGYWENKYYEENTHAGIETLKIESPWLNTPAHEPGTAPNGSIRVRTEVYCSTDSGTEGVTETVDGKYISREWTEKSPVDQDKVKLVSHQPHSGGTKITTTLRYRIANDIPEHLRGLPVVIHHADGCIDSYSYALDGGILTTTHDNGYGQGNTVVQGIRTITTSEYHSRNLRSEIRYAIQDGQAYWLSSRTGVEFDNSGQCLKWVYNNTPEDYTEQRKDCCRVIWERDRDGTETHYTYNPQGQLTAKTVKGITYTYEYKGLTTIISRQLAGDAEKYPVSQTTKNLAGRIIRETAPAFGGGELVTAYRYSIADKAEAEIHPTGITSSSIRYSDGLLQASISTTGITIGYTYSPTQNNGGGIITGINEGDIQTTRTEDLLGNLIEEQRGEAKTIRQYDPRGILIKETNPDGEITLTNEESASVITCLDKNRNGEIDLDTDTATRRTVTFDPAWPENTGSWKTTQEVAYQGQWQIADSHWITEDRTRSRRQIRGISGYETTTSPPVHRTQAEYAVTTTYPAGYQKIILNTRNSGILTSNTITYKDHDGVSIVSYRNNYSPWGLVTSSVDPRIGTTSHIYDTATGLPLASTTPAGNVTATDYDNYGRPVMTTLPDGGRQYRQYDVHGRVLREWGSRTYPVRYEYDAYGRTTALYTYRGPADGADDWPEGEGDKTTWVYDDITGQPAGKLYPDGRGMTCLYTLAGKLKSVRNARGTTAAIQYDPIGQLSSLSYDDEGITPAKTFSYNQLGNLVEAHTHGVVRYLYEYSEGTFAPVKEDIAIDKPSGGRLERKILRKYDDYGRSVGYSLYHGNAEEQAITYFYNSFGQMDGILADGRSFRYTYLDNAPNLITGMEGPSHMVENLWETNRNILAAKHNRWKNRPDSSLISSYAYGVNPVGQRISLTASGEAFGNFPVNELWNYDVLGQLEEDNGSSYQYDSIGNRILVRNQEGVAHQYIADSSNRYASVRGIGREYDPDGNLIRGLLPGEGDDERHQLEFAYDADNRPVTVKKNGETLATYSYDHLGRRIIRDHALFLYHGYHSISEYDVHSKHCFSRAWGLDMSGSLNEEGGVGALLAETDYRGQMSLVSYPLYDGNGNITQYITDTALQRHYEYDAFGIVKKSEGTKDYTYQFSTKPYDSLTGLNYYNYRFYDSATGRWTTRDPVGESGGFNLYGFIMNDVPNRWDVLGLAFSTSHDEGSWENGGFNDLQDTWRGSTNIPKPTDKKDTKNEVEVECEDEKAKPKKYKVAISASKEFDVEVKSYVVNDRLGKEYTEAGLEAIRGHEKRRVEVYRNAYDAYLKIFEGEIKNKCSKSGLNKLQANNYKKKLDSWLGTQQGNAKKEFSSWSKKQQEKISKENDPKNNFKYENGLIDGIIKIHNVANPNPLKMECPK